jgi:hypothetical protein
LLPVEIFFKALPGWFIAVGLYVLFAFIQQKNDKTGQEGGKK